MGNRVISIVQLSPGCGKTTLATNLAGELSRFRRVALIDCNPLSRRAAQWAAKRQEELYSDSLINQTAGIASALLERVYRLRESVDYVILDGSSQVEMTSAMAALSHLCLVPLSPVQADAHCAETIKVLRKARQLRKFRVRGVTVGQVQHRYREPAESERIKVVKATLCERRAYADALEVGRTGAESSDPIAREELHLLAMEVADLTNSRFAATVAGQYDPVATITQMPGPRSLLRL